MLPYKEARRTFAALLDWHLENGTRPPGHLKTGRAWKNSEFARSLRANFSPKAVVLWRTGRHRPRVLHYIEHALFGQSAIGQHAVWRDDLQKAYARSKPSEATAVAEPPDHEDEATAAYEIASLGYGASADCSYDFGRSASVEDFAVLREGIHILYEERSLDPSFDAAVYERNAVLLIPERPFRISPRGFVKLDAADYEWIDPRNRRRRICAGTIWRILPDGRVQLDKYGIPLSRLDIVDILPSTANGE
jgi:hypothetical protein